MVNAHACSHRADADEKGEEFLEFDHSDVFVELIA